MIKGRQIVFDKPLQSLTYFTEKTSLSEMTTLMAHFEANYHAMPFGTTNNGDDNMKISTRTLKSGMKEKFGKKIL